MTKAEFTQTRTTSLATYEVATVLHDNVLNSATITVLDGENLVGIITYKDDKLNMEQFPVVGVSFYLREVEGIVSELKVKGSLSSPEELLQSAKELKIREIEAYDVSNEVNVFYYNESPMWLSREERIVIKDRFMREKEQGVSTTNLNYMGNAISVTPDLGIALVDKVSAYADKCFDAKWANINTVNALEDIDEVKNFDVSTNYPEIVRL